MRIKSQFVVCLIVFTVAMAIIAVSVANTEQQLACLGTQQEITHTIEREANSLNGIFVNYFLYQENPQLIYWNTTISSMSNDLANLNATSAEQQLHIDTVKEDLQLLNTQFDDVAAYLQSTPRNVSVRIDLAFQYRWSTMVLQSQTLATDAAQLSQSINEQARQINLTNILLILSLVGTFGAFLATIYLMVFRKTLKSVTKLQNGISTIGTGNFDYRINIEGQNEIAQLAHSFNQMTTNLKNVTASKTDLEREVSERKKAEEKTQQQNATMAGINKIFQEALSACTEEDLGQICLDVAEEITQSKFGFIDEIKNEGLEAIAISNPGWDACRTIILDGKRQHGTFKIHGIYGRVISNGKGFFTNDPPSHPDSTGLPAGHPPIKAFLGVPLMREAKTIGIIAVANREGGYTNDQLESLEALAPAIVEAFLHKRAGEALSQRNKELEHLQIKLEEKASVVEEYASRMENLAEERARKLQDAERLAAIGATAGMVGHDIRNPLQAITGDLFLAKADLSEDPETEGKKRALESIDEIEKNVDYINKIVQDLQDYARPLNPKVEESDLKSLFEKLIAKNRPPENVKVIIEVADEARKTSADPYYLNRILYNLVTNSVQAMPQGGKLTIEAYKETNDTVITVKDTGVGIPKEIQSKMFTPMFTTKSKGQGFGLPVVKRMTESLGGTVSFESQEGKGTTFIVRLPSQKNPSKVTSAFLPN